MRKHPPLTPGSLDDPAFQYHLLHHLLLARSVEQRCIRNVRLGLQAKFFSAWGNEATSVGTAAALGPDDILVPMHRSLGAHLVRGHSLHDIFLQAFLKRDSQTGARDTGLHLGAPGTNIIGMISPLGSMNPVAAGIALAERRLGRDTVVMAYIGDGGSSLGVFHEALNLIGVQGLPVVTVIENNQWAYGTPNRLQYAAETLADRGRGYGMPGVRVDGTDLAEVYEVAREAVERARRGDGPTLIESVTMRMRGHAEHDPVAYVPKAMLEEWAKRDPVDGFIRWIEDHGDLDLDIEALRESLAKEVLAASDLAQAAPDPDPDSGRSGVFFGDGGRRKQPINGSTVGLAPDEDTTRILAAEVAAREAVQADRTDVEVPAPGSTVTYLAAIRECMRVRMKGDARVVVLGEDIGIMGGAFKMTDGFLGEFGEGRVVDFPIAEAALIGAGIGMAIRGFRPVLEIQFADFVASGFNELINNAGTFRYRIGVGVPLVVRLPSAGGVGAGPFHSLNPEAWFAHAAGLKIVIPATVEDAYGLMNAAIDDPDPVLFLEQKYLYRRLKGPLPARDHTVPLGRARIAREGKDATIVTWGLCVERALSAAAGLADEGIDVEIVDLRSIVPWDKGAVEASVRKTSRLLVLHEARLTVGFGAEVAAWTAEHLFEWLDAPVKRLGADSVPIPSHKALEARVTPQVAGIAASVRDLTAF
jgi:2-oxoisovalerate dehydrogenase E1 component